MIFAPGGLHSALGPRQHAGDLILELEAFLLEVFEHLIRGRLFLRLDPKDLAIDLVVTAGPSPKQIIGLFEPHDERGLVGKLVLQFVWDVHRRDLIRSRGWLSQAV